MKEGDPYYQIDRLGRRGLQLQAEYNDAADERERRIALIQLRALDGARKRYTNQIETLEQLPTVFETVYGEGEGYIALFAGQRRNRRLVHPREGYFPYPGGIDHAQAWVRSAAAADREVYLCAHLTTEKRRRKETAAPLWSLYVDLDEPAAHPEAVPKPSLVVESSPGRFQYYWSLTEPVPPTEGERLNRQLAAMLGADKSGWDTTQLLRAPGGFNHKYPETPLVRVAARRDIRYHPTAVANPLSDLPLFQSPSRQPVQPPASTGGAESDPRLQQTPPLDADQFGNLSRAARQIWRGDAARLTPDGQVDRSRSLLQIARVLVGMGLSRAQMVTALAERDETLGWRKYSDRPDAQRQYEHIVDVITQPQDPRRNKGR